jgi:AcrR family transcriptional regulator
MRSQAQCVIVDEFKTIALDFAPTTVFRYLRRCNNIAAMSTGRPRLSASERRAQLIDVGRAVFAKRGYEGASLEEIADGAKVSRPVLYEHFGGKEGLYAVIIDREMEYLVRRIAESISSGTPRERVEAAALAFLTYVKDHPDGFAVLTHDAPVTTAGGGMSSLLNDVAERVGHVFAAAFKDAGFDPKTAPIYAHALVGMVTFVGQWWTESRKPSVEEVASHIAALAWMGLRHLPKKPAKLSTTKR